MQKSSQFGRRKDSNPSLLWSEARTFTACTMGALESLADSKYSLPETRREMFKNNINKYKHPRKSEFCG